MYIDLTTLQSIAIHFGVGYGFRQQPTEMWFAGFQGGVAVCLTDEQLRFIRDQIDAYLAQDEAVAAIRGEVGG